MGNRSPIGLHAPSLGDERNKMKRRHTHPLFIYGPTLTWLIVLSHIPTLCSTSISSCLYMIHYGWSVGRSHRSATVHIPLEYSRLYYIPTSSSFSSTYFTASKIFAIPIIPSVVAKKESIPRFQTPLYQHPLFISSYWVL